MLEELYPFPTDVYLREEDHTYWSKTTGKQFLSVSKLLDMYEEPFDAHKISRASAKKELEAAGDVVDYDTIERLSAEKRQGWKLNGQAAADRGTAFHQAIEFYLTKGQILYPEWEKQIRRFAKLFQPYYRNYSEIICYTKRGVAGTDDHIGEHSNRSRKILHVSDFKTNKVKPVPEYKYSKWMKGILSHLPQNKFNRYALQMSLYGCMLIEAGFSIATMTIIWIDMEKMLNDEEIFHELIPVPFMKHEADAMLEEARMIQL